MIYYPSVLTQTIDSEVYIGSPYQVRIIDLSLGCKTERDAKILLEEMIKVAEEQRKIL